MIPARESLFSSEESIPTGSYLQDNEWATRRPPSIEMGVTVSFAEIFGRPATIEGVRTILAQYKRESVLIVLSKLSAALRLWFLPDFEKDNGLARDVFINASRADEHTMPGRPRRLFFTRLGVLATARLALSVWAPDAGWAHHEATT